MEAMTQSWTDDRIDDLAKRVDNGFAQVDRRFEQVSEEQRELRIALERSSTELRSEIKAMGDSFNQRFDRLQQVLLAGAIAATMTMIAAIVTLIT
jgi:DNA anti-recombination protein RmuC